MGPSWRHPAPALLAAVLLLRLVSCHRLLSASIGSPRGHAPSLADFGAALPEGATISEAELDAIVQTLVEARGDEEANRCTISLEPLLVDGKAGPDGLVAVVEPPGEGARPGAGVRVNMYNVPAARRWYCVPNPVDPVINLPLRGSSRVLLLTALEGPFCPPEVFDPVPGRQQEASPEFLILRAAVLLCDIDGIRSRLGTMTNASVRERDVSGRTVLFSAVASNCSRGATLLMERMDAASIGAPDATGWAVLHDATLAGQHELVSLLLARMEGEEVHARVHWMFNHRALDMAALEGFVETTRELLAVTGADELRAQDRHRRTALHLAADPHVASYGVRGRFDAHNDVVDKCAVIRLLLERMDDDMVQLQDADGWNALHLAVTSGAPEAAHTLLAGMSERAARAPDRAGRTALHHAADSGLPGVLHTLLGTFPDDDFLTARDGTGHTALHFAMAKRGGPDCDNQCESQQHLVRELLERMNRSAASAAHIVARSQGGRTALHDACARAFFLYAISAGHAANVKLLLRYMGDEDIAAADLDNTTALHIAAGRGLPEIVPALLSRMGRAAIGAQDRRGMTALHHAAHGGTLSLVRLIAGRMDRAALDARDAAGKTALQILEDQGVHEAAQIMAHEVLAQ